MALLGSGVLTAANPVGAACTTTIGPISFILKGITKSNVLLTRSLDGGVNFAPLSLNGGSTPASYTNDISADLNELRAGPEYQFVLPNPSPTDSVVWQIWE